MVTLASGTRVSLAYVRERVRGTTPSAVGTPIVVGTHETGGSGAGYSHFLSSGNEFITSGFYPGQLVVGAGFTDTDINATWRVHAVSAGVLEVFDPGDVIGTEAEVAQTLRIALCSLRATGRNINLEKNILESAEVRASRQKSDVRHGFNRVVGSPGWEWSRGAYNDVLELVLGSSFYKVDLSAAGNLTSGTGAAGYGTFALTTGSFITYGVRPGDIVRTASFAGSNNNGDWRVVSVVAGTITVYDPDDTITVEGPVAATIAVPGMRIDVGTALNTVTMERQFGDVTKYEPFLGCAFDQFGFSVQPEAIVGGTLNILGMIASAMAGSSISSSDPEAAAANSPFAAFDGRIFEGMSLIAVVTGVDGTLANNRSLNPVVGSKYSPDVFEGTAILTGTLMAYFQDETLRNKFVNETESSLWIKLVDPNALTTHFTNIVMPRVKYNGGAMDPPQEGPVPLEMPFQALEQADLASPGGTTADTCLSIQVSDTHF